MIALDTNVLVRFLVEDDEAQTEQAAQLIERSIANGEQLFISDVVVCETVWVLARSYKTPRKEISAVMERLLRAAHLAFSDSLRLSRALATYTSGAGDFADYLIREHATSAGCKQVATFDAALLREAGFIEPRSA